MNPTDGVWERRFKAAKAVAKDLLGQASQAYATRRARLREEDASARLDELMDRLRGDAAKKRRPDSVPNDTPDIIDGEVVSEDD